MREKREGEKWCFKCKAWHPNSSFHRNRNNADGLQHWCKKSLSEHYAANKKKPLVLKSSKNVASTANT